MRVFLQLLTLCLMSCVVTPGARAQQESPRPNSAGADSAAFKSSAADKEVTAFLKKHCQRCHGDEAAEAALRMDQLPASLHDVSAQQKWRRVMERVQDNEMPPTTEPRPEKQDAERFVQTIGDRIRSAQLAGDAINGRVVLRRLNRVEYENTIGDLLGIQVNLQELLPADTSAEGFDNNAAALHTSSFLLDRYLEAADKSLSLAIANLPQPPLVKKRLSLKEERHVKVTTEKVFRHRDDALVMFSSSPWQGITVGQFYPQHRGTYRVRISARGFQTTTPVTFRVDGGPMLMGTKNHLVGYFSVPPDESTVIEFVDHFEARSMIRLLPHGLETAQAVNKVGADQYEGRGLAVEWVEVEGPLHESWPPASHRAIFGDLPQKPAPSFESRQRVEVESQQPESDAERILHRFATRAFRRYVTSDELRPLLDMVNDKLAEGYSFEQAVRVGLKAILISPSFLFLEERPEDLDDFQIASRLSYFLWSTMPDDTLRDIAENGVATAADGATGRNRLRDRAVLREQVERMLSDPKARAFTQNFTGQWLGLRDIDFTEPDRRLFPEFDDMLKASMVDEAHAFFDEVLKNNLSVSSFVHSNFVMVNERLATHYEIEGVSGHEIRKVPIPAPQPRGGVMTMGAVLKVTANGTTTSPVMRGAWVLDRILGTPPEPPPAGISAIEPDIRGAVTIREQLAKHREHESCATCHRFIDPLGFALESFDVTGKWRDDYRTLGRGKTVMIDGRRMMYLQGPPVDPTGQLADGKTFRDIRELKQLLLADQDLIARAMITRLVTYATGCGPRLADEPAIDAIVETVREKDYGLRDIVHEIVASPLFLRK